jgi:site-specific DNA recombinase
MKVRAGIYVRISQDRTGLAAGVARQEADCRALCERVGWEVAAVFSDNDVSASSGRRRAGFEALKDALRGGTINGVVAWHPDRLTRKIAELESLVDLLNETRAKVQTVQTGTWDLTSASGRMQARIIGAAAQYEAELKGERASRKALEIAEAGMPNGGGPRPFGYEADGVTVREDEAAMIRQAAVDVLNGRGLTRIANSWPPVTGQRWDSRGVKRVLLSPRVIGLRAHRGSTYPAVWPAVLEPDVQEAVRAVLTDPARDSRPARPRSYLLLGLAKCGECGRNLEGKPDHQSGRRYVCVKERGGCGGVSRRSDPIEELVIGRVLRKCQDSDRRPATSTIDPEATAKVRGLEARLAQLEAWYEEGKFDDDPAHYLRLHTRTKGALAAAQAAVELVPVEWQLGPAEGGWRRVVDPWRAWWEQADLTQRRSLLAEHLEAVVVHRALRGRNTFDPDKIELVWRP